MPPARVTRHRMPDQGATSALVSPSGILSGGNTYLTNSHVTGRYTTYTFLDLEPSNGVFDWSKLDPAVAAANAGGKTFTLLLNLNSGDPGDTLHRSIPGWLVTAGAVVYDFVNDSHGTILPLFLPWDPVWQAAALTLIATLCDRYDGKIASISMGGLGSNVEMHMASPSPDGLSDSAASTAWLASSKIIISQYASHLKQTAFICAGALPYPDPYGTTVFNALVAYNDANFGSHVGYEQWGLNAHSADTIPPSFPPNLAIYNHRFTNPVGFQMTGSAVSGGGGNLCGSGARDPACLLPAMQAGVNLGAQYLQVYGQDCDSATYQPDLDTIRTQLLSPPP